MPTCRIPFNKPCLAGNEMQYALEAITRGHSAADGIFTERCHALLEHDLGVTKVLLTTSCTHALELAAMLLEIQPGDEVIVPSFTFVSTANAFVLLERELSQLRQRVDQKTQQFRLLLDQAIEGR
jgi:dTDP-4-amino-4,6-dideoxygalactose transaminase